jgi:putative transposase
MTDSERKALSEEYRRRNGVKPDSAISMQRLREFLQTYTPDGAMALHRARQAENKNLYVGMNQAWVQPPVATPSHGILSFPGTPERADHQQTSLPPGTDIELPEYDTF